MGSGGGAWKPIVFLGGTKFRLRQGFPPENPCDAALAASARLTTTTLFLKEITL